MEGGFVTRNCSQCGKKAPLPESDFLKKIDLWVSCPQCKQKMRPEVINKNYGYACHNCDVGIDLADLLPHWDDL
jgi:NAD-dependent SIR2 family protein deacetylase